MIEYGEIQEYHSFYKPNGELIDVATITVENGKFSAVTDKDGNQITEFTHVPETLHVKGIGNLMDGDIVKLKHMDKCFFRLKYGWHKNISNQVICSWYLVPSNIKDIPNPYSPDGHILTFYHEYLETIERVDYDRLRSSFIEGED